MEENDGAFSFKHKITISEIQRTVSGPSLIVDSCMRIYNFKCRPGNQAVDSITKLSTCFVWKINFINFTTRVVSAKMDKGGGEGWIERRLSIVAEVK